MICARNDIDHLQPSLGRRQSYLADIWRTDDRRTSQRQWIEPDGRRPALLYTSVVRRSACVPTSGLCSSIHESTDELIEAPPDSCNKSAAATGCCYAAAAAAADDWISMSLIVYSTRHYQSTQHTHRRPGVLRFTYSLTRSLLTTSGPRWWLNDGRTVGSIIRWIRDLKSQLLFTTLLQITKFFHVRLKNIERENWEMMY